jgi:hypothetical protein
LGLQKGDSNGRNWNQCLQGRGEFHLRKANRGFTLAGREAFGNRPSGRMRQRQRIQTQNRPWPDFCAMD